MVWVSLELWERYPETAKEELMREAALLSGEAHALSSSYMYDDSDAWSDSAWDGGHGVKYVDYLEDEEGFTRWYEQQSLALQEDHWQQLGIGCGSSRR